MNYTETNDEYRKALEYIHGTVRFGSKLGLENIKKLLELMGNPHKKLKFVHIAGTNGKGSTAAYMSSILQCAGYKTGLYTSPYIFQFTERIKINGCEIEKDKLAKITGFVKGYVEKMKEVGYNHPTEFEIVTAIAFQYFLEMKCDVVVLEVGLGGRFDATNVIDMPLVAIITTISYDHMDRLGNTLSEIAFEKAGIIKPGADVVLYPQQEEAEEVFVKVCRERGARLHRPLMPEELSIAENIEGQVFDVGDKKNIRISLHGRHQTKNAAVAIAAAGLINIDGRTIPESVIREGLALTKWAGRFEIIAKNPFFIIDAAHNQEGAEVFLKTLLSLFPDKKYIFINGVRKDKDIEAVLGKTARYAHCIVTATPKCDLAVPAAESAEFVKKYCNCVYYSDTIEKAVDMAYEICPEDGVICAFGSLYMIGYIREHVLNMEKACCFDV